MKMNFSELRFRTFLATGILAGLCVVATVLLVVLVAGARTRAETFESLRSQVQNRRSAMVPPQTVDGRVKEAREQIAHFYEDRFPASSSAIFEQLGKVASENKVRLNQATYKTADTDMPGVQLVEITAHLTGPYAQTMKFINSLERDKMFFIVDGVALGDQNGGNVVLNVKVETYMRGGAS
jgi:type IV pilus assembly protein PilO